jgi:hypothetical protein
MTLPRPTAEDWIDLSDGVRGGPQPDALRGTGKDSKGGSLEEPLFFFAEKSCSR